MKQFINISLLLLYFILISLFSCEESTKPETVTFSGIVTLEGETDFSGVKVSLYKPVELDTALVRINQQYPNIGVQISQETEFDHREHTPKYSTKTNASGAWKIEDVTPGTYNVVAEKDSFGWLTKYNVNPNTINFELFKNIILNSNSNSSLVFESNKTYILNKDIILSNMASIQFESNTRLILDSNNDLTINNSTLSFPDTGWVHITSTEGIVNAKIILEECYFDINRLIFNNINKGLKALNCTDGILKSSRFKNNGTAILPEYCTNLTIENVLIDKNVEAILPKSGTLNVTNCVFYSNNKGLENLAGDVQLTNNLFLDNFIGATFISTQTSKVEHCEFDRNGNSSLNIIGVDLEVYYNTFKGDSNCSIYVGSDYVSSSPSSPLINNNNLLGDNISLSQSGNPEYIGTNYRNSEDIDAKNNYWNRIILIEIENRIIDYNDNTGFGLVSYEGHKLSMINGTGIQK